MEKLRLAFCKVAIGTVSAISDASTIVEKKKPLGSGNGFNCVPDFRFAIDVVSAQINKLFG